MPYSIVKDGDKYCVEKTDTGKRVPGGCHDTKKEAIDHMQAIEINSHSSLQKETGEVKDGNC